MDGPGTVPSRENLSIGDRVAGEDGITGDRVVGELVEKGSRLDLCPYCVRDDSGRYHYCPRILEKIGEPG